MKIAIVSFPSISSYSSFKNLNGYILFTQMKNDNVIMKN